MTRPSDGMRAAYSRTRGPLAHFRHVVRAAVIGVFASASQIDAAPDLSTGAKPCVADSAQRPYVLLNRELLERLRQDAKSSGSRAFMYGGFRKNAERWLNRNIEVPARSGHFHNFVCTDGTRLSVPANQKFDQPTSGPFVYSCPACGKTYTGEKFEGAMRQQEHVWLIQACRDLALVGAVESRKDLQQKAAEILVKYADAYPDRHTGPTAGGIFYQSLDESVHFIALAQAYDLIYDAGVLSDDQKRHIENDLFWEAAEGFMKVGIGGNWGSWHLSGVGVIGLATRHQRYLDFGLKSFKSQITNQLGDDGLWPESVHTYHFYPMRGFLHFAEGCANVGIDLYGWEAKPGKSLKAMFTEPLHYMYPNFQLPAINDGWYWSYLPQDIYQIGWKRYKLPELAWAVRELQALGEKAMTKSPDTVALWSLLHDEPLPANLKAPQFRSRNFPVLGISALRLVPDWTDPVTALPSDDLMMTFDYGRHLGHGQNDLMGITFFGKGRLIAPDYGTPSYGSDIMPYYKGTASHNTIMFDGRNTPHATTHTLLEFADEGYMALSCAETREAAKETRWRRLVLLTDRYGMTFDQITSQEPHDVRWLLHAEGEILDRPVFATITTGTLNMPNLEDIRMLESDQRAFGVGWIAGGNDKFRADVSCLYPCDYFAGMAPADTATRRIPMLIAAGRHKSQSIAALYRILVPGFCDEQSTSFTLTSATGATYQDGQVTDFIEFDEDTIRFRRTMRQGIVLEKTYALGRPEPKHVPGAIGVGASVAVPAEPGPMEAASERIP